MRPAPRGYSSARSSGLHRPSCRGGRLCPPDLRPHSFLSLLEKEKNRRGVRRSQLHCASAGAAKAPYPLAPSSFPNCDRFAGSQFGDTGALPVLHGPLSFLGRLKPFFSFWQRKKRTVSKSPQLSGSFRSGRSPMTQPCGFLHTGQTFHASSASTIWPQFAQRQTMGFPFL